MRRCPNNHFYDETKFKSCPHCGGRGAKDDPTTPVRRSRAAPAPTAPAGPTAGTGPDLDPTTPMGGGLKKQVSGATDDVTKPFSAQKTGMNPAVGWLVCIKGPDRGTDYRLYAQNNLIGRGEGMAVRLEKDKTISREPYTAIVSYDPNANKFMVLPGGTQNMVSLDGNAIYAPTVLTPYARIILGETTLLFVPLCGEHFQWPNESGEAS